MVNDQRFVGVSNFYPTTFEKADATAQAPTNQPHLCQ
jgi:hypothetical protein